MAEAGRVRHHIAECIEHPENTIFIVGYCEPSSLGGRLKKGVASVKLFGNDMEVRAEVASITSMSAHGDYDDLGQWLSCQDEKQVKGVFLVHGEYEVQVALRDRLMRKGFVQVEIPDQHQEIGIGETVLSAATEQ
jgi:metallo-beta-lactamase family protein